MHIQIDSREKARAITKIIKEFDNQGVQHFVSKLYVGDYMSYDNPRLIIDRKQNLNELCSNVAQEHARFKTEIENANNAGIKLVFLCEHGGNIKTLEDVEIWNNPRLKYSPKAVTGERLYKILRSIRDKYSVDFLFCKKADTGRMIIDLLGG